MKRQCVVIEHQKYDGKCCCEGMLPEVLLNCFIFDTPDYSLIVAIYTCAMKDIDKVRYPCARNTMKSCKTQFTRKS